MTSFCFCEMMILMFGIIRVLQAICHPGWLTWQDSCYILLPQKMNWTDASKACDRPGVSLVFPNSMEEQDFVWGVMTHQMEELGAQSVDDLQLWINCYRHDGEHFNCSGYEGTSKFRNWDSGGQSSLPGEKCVRMADTVGGKWADITCPNNYFVACEMSALAYGCQRSGPRYIHVPQQCLLNHQIKSYPVKESIGCGLACWAEPLCRSFNLWKQADSDSKKICQLNNASHMEADVIDMKDEENCYFYAP